MITDDDVKKLKKTFATKDEIADLREQICDDIDGKLKKQKVEIVADISDFIADNLLPIIDNHGKRITKLEHTVGISSAPG